MPGRPSSTNPATPLIRLPIEHRELCLDVGHWSPAIRYWVSPAVAFQRRFWVLIRPLAVTSLFYAELGANLCEQVFQLVHFSFETRDVGLHRREFRDAEGWRLSR